MYVEVNVGVARNNPTLRPIRNFNAEQVCLERSFRTERECLLNLSSEKLSTPRRLLLVVKSALQSLHLPINHDENQITRYLKGMPFILPGG